MNEERRKRILYINSDIEDWFNEPYHDNLGNVEVFGYEDIDEARKLGRGFDLFMIHLGNTNDHYEFAKRIRKERPNALIISMTGSDKVHNTFRKGLNTYEDNPFDDCLIRRHRKEDFQKAINYLENLDREIQNGREN